MFQFWLRVKVLETIPEKINPKQIQINLQINFKPIVLTHSDMQTDHKKSCINVWHICNHNYSCFDVSILKLNRKQNKTAVFLKQKWLLVF